MATQKYFPISSPFKVGLSARTNEMSPPLVCHTQMCGSTATAHSTALHCHSPNAIPPPILFAFPCGHKASDPRFTRLSERGPFI